MLRFLLRRLLHGLLVVWLVTSATFALLHLAPGGPALLADPKLSPVERRAIEQRLGIDQPLLHQYAAWHRALLRGDLGRSFLYQTPALGTIAARLPDTLLRTALPVTAAQHPAVPLGDRVGRRPGPILLPLVTGASLLWLSLPGFWFGIVLIILFAAEWHILPAGGASTPGLEGSVVDRVRHLVLPVTVLALPIAAELLRYLRAGVRAASAAPHLRAARARGLTETAVTARHLVRNALLPLATVVGLQVPLLVGGAAVTETVFAWPGLGRLSVDAMLRRDFPLIQGAVLGAVGAFALVNLAVDLLYAGLDPRIRYSKA